MPASKKTKKNRAHAGALQHPAYFGGAMVEAQAPATALPRPTPSAFR